MDILVTNQRLIDKFVDLVNQISPGSRIALFYDPDGDGTCASVLLQKALERLGRKVVLISNDYHGSVTITAATQELLVKHRVTHVFTLDLPVDHDPQNFEVLKNFSTIIIDHHPTMNVNHPRNILLMKPEFFTNMKEPSYYCTTKLAYDLMLKLVDISDLRWLAITGIVADYCWKDWDVFLRDGFKQYDVTWNDYLYDTDFGMLTKLIGGAASFIDGRTAITECRERLYQSQNLPDALNRLQKFNVVNERIEDYITHFEDRAEKHVDGDLLILELKEPYNISSAIATGVSLKKFPHHFVLVVQEKGDDLLGLSARAQQGSSFPSWNTNEILRECVVGLDQASGGGHVAASGGRVHKKDYLVFKQRLIDCVAAGSKRSATTKERKK